jgi:hypothetical protein
MANFGANKTKENAPQFDLDKILSSLPVNNNDNLVQSSNKSSVSGGAAKTNTLSDKYVEVSLDNIGDLPVGTYIRYKDADGNLKPGGGRVKELVSDKGGAPAIKLYSYNGRLKKSFVWTVKVGNISHLYRYVRDETAQLLKSVTKTTPSLNNELKSGESDILDQLGNKMLFNDNEMLKQKIDTLEAEVAKLSADQKKMFMVIKRLHNIVHQNSALSAE